MSTKVRSRLAGGVLLGFVLGFLGLARAEELRVDIQAGQVFLYAVEGELWDECPSPVAFWPRQGGMEATLQAYPFGFGIGFCYPNQGKVQLAEAFALDVGDPRVDPGEKGRPRETLPFQVSWEPTEKGWKSIAVYRHDKAGGPIPVLYTANGSCELLGAHIEAQVQYDRENRRVDAVDFFYTIDTKGTLPKAKGSATRLTPAQRLDAMRSARDRTREPPMERAKVPMTGQGRRSTFHVKLTMSKFVEASENAGINAAVEKGVWFLRLQYLASAAERIKLARRGALNAAGAKYQNAHASRRNFPVGRDALVALALSESGVSKDEPAMARTIGEILGAASPELKTYEAGIVLMLLESATRHEDEYGKGHRAVGGQWRGAAESIRQRLLRNGDAHRWTYTGRTLNGDNSNTQYAFLGLRAATKMGLKTRDGDWRSLVQNMVADLVKSGQKADLKIEGKDLLQLTHTKGPSSQVAEVPYDESAEVGGWSYKGGRGYTGGGDAAQGTAPTFNMTCALLSDLAIAIESLGKGCPEEVHQAMRSGWAYIQQNMPGMHHPEGYRFYGLERICVFYQIDRINGIDWYRDGAASLVAIQRNDGGWVMQYGEDVDTAYALLFLKRATVELSYGNEQPYTP